MMQGKAGVAPPLTTRWSRGTVVALAIGFSSLNWAVVALAVCFGLAWLFPEDTAFPDQAERALFFWKYAAVLWVPMGLHKAAYAIAEQVDEWQRDDRGDLPRSIEMWMKENEENRARWMKEDEDQERQGSTQAQSIQSGKQPPDP